MCRRLLCIMGMLLTIAACERSNDVQQPAPRSAPREVALTTPEDALSQDFSLEAMSRGAEIYKENCAECHGPQAQGHPGWEEDAKGEFVMAPPLDARGPTVRRSKQELVNIINNGRKRGNDSVMPGWKGRLSTSDIDDTILWFQALWPPEVYDHWQKANADTATTAGTPSS